MFSATALRARQFSRNRPQGLPKAKGQGSSTSQVQAKGNSAPVSFSCLRPSAFSKFCLQGRADWEDSHGMLYKGLKTFLMVFKICKG